MNLLSKQTYSQKDLRRKLLFERKYVKQVFNALQEQMQEAAGIVSRQGIDALELRLEHLVFVNDLSVIIRNLWEEVAIYYGNKTLREINRSAKEEKAGFGFNEQWLKELLEYFARYLLTKAVLPISQTTKDQILSILSKGKTEGWGADRIAFELVNDKLTIARARLIVRTENVMAQNYGKQLGKRESRYETIDTWISAHDSRTRHGHKEADGQTIDEGGRFRVNRYRKDALIGYDLMTGPGDPSAHADNLCNCRCTSATTARRDENGNLILKRKKSNISVILPGQFVRRGEIITI